MLDHNFFLQTAVNISKFGTCSRLQVGAVLSKDNRIIATGYNGSAEGLAHCYHEDSSRCHKSVHAETNTLAFAARHGIATLGSTLYCNYAPCGGCSGPLINAGIIEVHYIHDYRSDSGLRSFAERGIPVIKHGEGNEAEDEAEDGSCCRVRELGYHCICQG